MKKGRFLIRTGAFLIACSVAWAGYNLFDDFRAKHAAQESVNFLEKTIVREEDTAEASAAAGQTTVITQEPLSFPEAPDVVDVRKEVEIPDYVLNPNMAMPVLQHKGQDYIGTLEIPVLDLKIPVISQWNYSRLRVAPCRYSGSAYANNLVISGHNYRSHFGALNKLDGGERVIFTDVDGNVFDYRVDYKETLHPAGVDEMVSGDWDLTLFTCTVGGSYRVAVRCSLIRNMNLSM